ncbi:hypothetical protein GCM10009127_11900 [Alteraurantiacibacter aestuarii]|uniref:Energy transducer TonB n=1 Tax=Alteraurantiacibacter aestuarii TaxID=650004 RepID=A0A844ZKA5_9SPHN|nr:TonB C-terminal domain-containing protein [Alteraurantiacibacter aestuarii]MXO87576.1 energy transducer TonB [Alteraurantiacibacter aestuarii]
MATLANLSREEKLGLLVAGAAHVALAVALMLQDDSRAPYEPPQRIDVSLATDVSLTSTAPDPSAEPAASMAPEISDQPVPDPAPIMEVTPPRPVPDPPKPPPVQRTTPQRTERTVTRPTPTPTPRATQTQAPRPQPRPQPTSQATRMNDQFLQGMSDASGDSGSPARTVGPAEQASIGQAIIRQLKPHWNPPSGVDVERLVTVLRFRLNEDGSLAGNPEVVRQTGVTDSNRAQAGRHAEQAVRAVRLASPFRLPEEYYSGWRVVTSNFDNRLAQ